MAGTEPTPAAQPASEADASPEPEPTPEPAAETEPPASAPTPTTDPQSAPEPVAGTEPTPAAQPASEADASPEPEPTPEPEPADVPAPEAEPTTETTAEPAAAAEETAVPNAAPTSADETEPEPEADSTPGQAAEPQAEADAAPEQPQPAPATAAPEATTVTETEAPLPAERGAIAPSLLTAYDAAGAELGKRGLTGTRARVYLVLDRSASMRPYYKDGSAQALGEQALALAAHLDPEAKVHVVFFSTELDGTGELTLTDHENKIDELHAGLGRMGRTSYHAAVEEIVSHYDSTGTTTPALVLFQTDGAPDAKTPATQSLTKAAETHPSLFFSFIAFGDPENKAFDYLRKLKTGNTAHFLAGETPRELTDDELYEGVLADWRP
ncbi:VWA domain-containing protein [Streptomyces roseiscleroticus]|uniref:VWA domain-containing protein n=1 Tax=Streptomyces roseiscleroticus TaxID=1972 RepID=A0ABN3EZK6_9ACTN